MQLLEAIRHRIDISFQLFFLFSFFFLVVDLKDYLWNGYDGPQIHIAVKTLEIKKKQLLSFSRKKINLLFKKKKKQTNKKTHRPLSLTNTDYKVYAFILARKLQNVINNLTGNEQSAYIKCQNCFRYLQNCIKKYHDELLLFLYYEKAFDSVD